MQANCTLQSTLSSDGLQPNPGNTADTLMPNSLPSLTTPSSSFLKPLFKPEQLSWFRVARRSRKTQPLRRSLKSPPNQPSSSNTRVKKKFYFLKISTSQRRLNKKATRIVSLAHFEHLAWKERRKISRALHNPTQFLSLTRNQCHSKSHLKFCK